MAAMRKRPAPADAAGELKRKRVRVTFGSIDDYEALEVVGEGSYGVVYSARHRGTGEAVAVKRAKHADAAGGVRAAVLREAACLAACRGHPSVVQIRDVVADAATGALFLVTELLGPSLRRFLQQRRFFSEQDTRAVMRQLLCGAARMHGAGIVHRDIKPENILVASSDGFGCNADVNVKICDLGMTAPTRPPGTPYSEARVGTLRYRAPEQLCGGGVGRCYGPAVDVWALGCVMAELLTGKLLFDAAKTEEGVRAGMLDLRDRLTERGLQAFDELPAFRDMPPLSQPAREVLAGLLAFNPDDRLTAAAALRHRWFVAQEAAEQPCRRRVARAPRSASASASLMVAVCNG